MKPTLISKSDTESIRFYVDKPVVVEEYEIHVTKIKNRYYARLSKGGLNISEMSCELRIDIGYICRQMMRDEDKFGGDKQTDASRNRLNTKPNNFGGPSGKVWCDPLKR